MKKIIITILILSMISSTTLTVLANTFSTVNSDNIFENMNASTFSERTGYYYMTIDGIRYRRLWSYTHQSWIDPEWSVY